MLCRSWPGHHRVDRDLGERRWDNARRFVAKTELWSLVKPMRVAMTEQGMRQAPASTSPGGDPIGHNHRHGAAELA
jgi:hypothetical protein